MTDPNEPRDRRHDRTESRDAGPRSGRDGRRAEETGGTGARTESDAGRSGRPDAASSERPDRSRQPTRSTPRGTNPRRPSGARSPRPNRNRSGFRAIAIAVVVVALAAGAFAWYRLSPPAATPDPVVFEVEPGWGARRVASELAAEGLIRDDTMFSLWLRLRGLDRRIGEGMYDLSPHLGAREIGRRLAAGGRPRTIAFVVPEGYRMSDVAARLAELGIAETEAALQRMREPGSLRPDFVPAGVGLEGYLFPASYEIEVDTDVVTVLERMLDRFRAEVGPREADRLVDIGLHVHEWVTLASMVQAEAANESEMPVIAGVFLNRRDRGMRMQSDPTVAYGLGKDLPELDAVAGDLRRDHPWNTYTRDGLPIGPIGNPGSAALQAVLAPRRSTDAGEPYLYFLHGFDGDRAVFRPNISLEAHERDIDRFLR